MVEWVGFFLHVFSTAWLFRVDFMFFFPSENSFTVILQSLAYGSQNQYHLITWKCRWKWRKKIRNMLQLIWPTFQFNKLCSLPMLTHISLVLNQLQLPIVDSGTFKSNQRNFIIFLWQRFFFLEFHFRILHFSLDSFKFWCFYF